ncbi:hypothetical protein CEQ36_08565 [Yersinia intermedia]|nr:hypothetical protein A6J67_18910 [Yersinia sp. FDAARGOS_228]AVL35672.1 hypothetical protein CEQ36_08565 [Yersinia intermedia]OVZ72865.1 hypothetical protein CBW55_23090 [Yersinia intermedia]
MGRNGKKLWCTALKKGIALKGRGQKRGWRPWHDRQQRLDNIDINHGRENIVRAEWHGFNIC